MIGNGSPIVGYLSDRAASRKIHYLIGLGSLILSTAFVATARTYWVLCVARVLQGCSSAIVWTVGMALLADTLPTNQLGIAMGTIGSVVSLAMVTAPVLGGTIFHHFGYEAVFYVLGGFLLLDVVLRLLMIERKDALLYGLLCDEETDSEADGENETLLPADPTLQKSLFSMVMVGISKLWAEIVTTVLDCIMDSIYQFCDPCWTLRCRSSPPSQRHLRLHRTNFRRHVRRPRRPRNDSRSHRRLDGRQIRQ
jgi:MFS family permease